MDQLVHFLLFIRDNTLDKENQKKKKENSKNKLISHCASQGNSVVHPLSSSFHRDGVMMGTVGAFTVQSTFVLTKAPL